MNDEEIIKGFKMLGIQETDYPEYHDAESFASMITEIPLVLGCTLGSDDASTEARNT